MYIHYDEPRSESVCRDIDQVLLAREELKLAIIQVLEEGDQGVPWAKAIDHPFGWLAVESRERLADAVIQRLGSL